MSVHAVVLAAGRGRRMGGSKHLLPVEGHPMLARVVEALRATRADGLVVVLRPGDDAGAALLAELGVDVAFAEPADEGRAASVRAGVRASPPDGGLLFAMADQPFLRAQDFDALIAAHAALAAHGDGEAGAASIVQAIYAGERGSPVLFGAEHRDELLALRGAQGGRAVIAAHPGQAKGVELDPEHGRDLDVPDDLPPAGGSAGR